MNINELFTQLAKRISEIVGSPQAFTVMFCITIGWIIGGVVRYGFGSDYQIPLNTLSSITTMLIAFLIQNTQARDTRALQLKLDELLSVTHGARPCFIGLEDCSDEEVEKLAEGFERLYGKGCLSENVRKHLAPIR
jgi:low affinity Fe/Cu permease